MHSPGSPQSLFILAVLTLTVVGTPLQATAQEDSIVGDITSAGGATGIPSAASLTQSVASIESKLDDVATASGSWSVTPSGSFSYTVPINVPTGRGNVQPTLALVYDSHTDNGLLGPGWTLRGIPAIERVQFNRGIRFDGGDQFAFNENGWGTPISGAGRLVEVASNVYHTAVESFREFRVFGDCDNGTCYWEMKDGEGLTYRFGGQANAALNEREAGTGVQRGAQAWSLTSVEDIHGNGYRIHYDKDEWMMYPSRLSYDCVDPDPKWPIWNPTESTPPAGESPTSPPTIPDGPRFPGSAVVDVDAPSIAVGYTPLPPPVIVVGEVEPPVYVPVDPMPEGCSFGGGSKRELVFGYYHGRSDRVKAPAQYHRALRSIAVLSAGQRVNHYEFGYEKSDTGISRLASIGRMASDMPLPLAEMTISWLDDSTEPYTPLDQISAPSVGNLPVSSHIGDINGDGFGDVVRVDAHDALNVSWRLGSSEGLGAAKTLKRSGENFEAENGAVKSYKDWQSLVADVNGDGLDDLVLWFGGNRRAFLMVANGRPNGLFGAFVHYADAQALMSFAHDVGPFAPRTYRMVTGDFNADQITDLALVNTFTLSFAYFPGSTTGLLPMTSQNGGGLTSPGYKFEPVVADFNADGIVDLLQTREAGNGSLATLAAIGTSSGLQGFATTAWGSIGHWPPPHPDARGWIAPPFQTLVGDFNGDRAADLTLAFSGPVSLINEGMEPYGRDVRTLFGHSDDRFVDWEQQVALSEDSPAGVDYAYNYLAYWQHHAGDFNCDGLTDVVAYYGGHDGQAVRVLQGQSDGSFATAETISGLQTAPAPAHTADGSRSKHKWKSRVADVNQDGCDDFLRYYAGPAGVNVDLALGTADGLSDQYVSEQSIPTQVEERGGTMVRAASITLLTPDIDGDGKLDLVLTTYNNIFVSLSGSGQTNLLGTVENGLGGSTEVSYESSPRMALAISASPLRCTSGADCGVPIRVPRHLVRSVTTDNGRGLREGWSYTYEDGRYYPGPLATAFSSTGRHSRADLGFSSMTVTDNVTGTRERTEYRRDWPFHRQAEKQERRDRSGILQRLVTNRYADSVAAGDHESRWGTAIVRLAEQRASNYEGGVLSRTQLKTWEYNDYGAVTIETREEGGWVSETHHVYDNSPSNIDRWLLNRPRERKVRPVVGEFVNEWTRYEYTNDLVSRVEEIRCEQDACPCFSIDNGCLSAGGQWVTTARDHNYDSYGNLTEVTDALGRKTTYTYDSDFNTYLASETRPLDPNALSIGTAPSTSSLNNPFLGQVVHVWILGAPTALTTSRTYDAAGRLTGETDPSGNKTTYAYDGFGRLERIDRPDGGRTVIENSPWGDPDTQRITRKELISKHGGVEKWTSSTSYFDGQGEVYRVEKSSVGSATEIHQRIRTQQNGRRVELIATPRLSTDSSVDVLWIHEERDDRDRLVRRRRIQNATATGGGTDFGTAEEFVYYPGWVVERHNAGDVDSDGRFLNDRWQETERHFDGRGLVWKVVDAEGHGTLYNYDAGRRPTFVIGPQAGLGASTSAEVEPGFCRTTACRFFRFNNRGNLVERYEPESGSVTHEYDALGNLLLSVDALGQATVRAYDSVNRILWTATDDGVSSYGYDVGASGALGRLVWREYPEGREDVDRYDELGRIKARTIEIDGLSAPQTETYVFDLLGRTTQAILADGTRIDYTWSRAFNALASVDVDGSEVARFEAFTGASRATRRVTPAGTTEYAYGADGVLDRIEADSSSAELLHLEYRHDGVGNVRSMTDLRQSPDRKTHSLGLPPTTGTISTEDTWAYEYDRLSQLTSARFRSQPATTYQYSPVGDFTKNGSINYTRSNNTLTATFNAADFTCRSPDGAPAPSNCHQPAGTHYVTATHDDAGNVIEKSRGTWRRVLNYDASHRLVSVADDGRTRATFTYNDGEQRIRKTAYGSTEAVTTYYVSEAYELRESSQSPGTLVPTRHIFAPGHGRVVTLTGSPTPTSSLALLLPEPFDEAEVATISSGIAYTFENELGSAVVITDELGRELARFIHDPWGNLMEDVSWGNDVTPRRFTGKETDSVTGMIYFGARYYDPDLARFSSADSIYPGGVLEPASLNRYAYVFNNPLRFVDPDGHQPVEDDSDNELLVEDGLVYESYEVQEGDTLGEIATAHEIDVDVLHALNPQLSDKDLIFPGNKIQVPIGKEVVFGDTELVAELLPSSFQYKTPSGIAVAEGVKPSRRKGEALAWVFEQTFAPGHLSNRVFDFWTETNEEWAGPGASDGEKLVGLAMITLSSPLILPALQLDTYYGIANVFSFGHLDKAIVGDGEE